MMHGQKNIKLSLYMFVSHFNAFYTYTATLLSLIWTW